MSGLLNWKIITLLVLAIGWPAEVKGPGAIHGAHVPTHHVASSHRDPAVPKAFQKQHPCPANGRTEGACPGYVRDHIVPLCKGGADSPSNMQWQTTAEGKVKDKVECKR